MTPYMFRGKLRDLFVNDKLGTASPTYDTSRNFIWYCLSTNGIISPAQVRNTITIPTVPSVTEDALKELIVKAFKNCQDISKRDKDSSSTNSFLLSDNCSEDVMKKYFDNFLLVNGLEEGYVYHIPDPEFFGILFTSTDGEGCGCFTDFVFKEKVS